MANHPSALKRHKQSLKRRARNRTAKAGIRTAIKRTLKACEAKDAPTAQQELKTTTSLLASAATKHILHKNNAARRISRLAKKVQAIQA